MEELIGVINTNVPSPYKEVALAVLTGGGAWYTKHLKDRSSKQKEIDAIQDKAAAEIKCITDSHAEILAKLDSKLERFTTELSVLKPLVESMAKTLEGYEEDKAKVGQVRRLRRAIQEKGNQWVTTTKDMPSSDYAMILDGCLKASVLFGEILQDGLDNFNPVIFKMKAITILKGIRNQAALSLSEEVLNQVKSEVMNSGLDALTIRLQDLGAESNYGDLEHVVIEFIHSFIKSFTEIRNSHDSK